MFFRLGSLLAWGKGIQDFCLLFYHWDPDNALDEIPLGMSICQRRKVYPLGADARPCCLELTIGRKFGGRQLDVQKSIGRSTCSNKFRVVRFQDVC